MAARAALVLAVVCAVWTLTLVIGGGFNLTIAGRTITSNDPVRPFALAFLAFVGYAYAAGIQSVCDRWSRFLTRLGERRLALLISLGTVLLGIAYSATAGIASDQYGYVSQADLWLRGDLFIPEPWIAAAPWPETQWTFAPLGYRPVVSNGTWAYVPIYSPGLPILMATAKLAGGSEVMYWVVPAFGGLLTWMSYGIGRRLGSARAGLIACWLVATSPAVLTMVMQPMSDIPVAAAWATTIFFALGRSTKDAALCGAASSIAILIRPNLALLTGVVWAWWLARSDLDRGASGLLPRVKPVLMYTACLLPGTLAIAVLYSKLYGSPFTSGYGDLGLMFSWQHIPPNVARYVRWFVESQGRLALVGVVALVLPVRAVWPWVSNRRALWMISGFLSLLVLQYLAYRVFEDWSFLRFLLTAWPFVMLGIATVAIALARPGRPFTPLLVSAVVIGLGFQGIQHARTTKVFDIWREHRQSVEVARILSKELPAASVIYSNQHTGTLRYYGGQTTLLFDLLAPDWLDRSVAWLHTRGISAYLLVEDAEVGIFKKRFAGQPIADTLDGRLQLLYGSTTQLYDLNGPLHATPRVIGAGDMKALRSAQPDPRAFDPQLAPVKAP